MINLAILANENPEDHLLWVTACKKFSGIVNYKIIDLTSSDWYDEIIEEKFDFFLTKPSGLKTLFKQLYDERVYILSNILKLPIYPKLDEILLYENKRLLSYWLKANNLPHPKTFIFYNKDEALDTLNTLPLPLVGKTNIGASGSGIKFMNTKNDIIEYITTSFNKNIPRRWGPNFRKGRVLQRGLHYIFHPNDIEKKINIYKTRKQDVQRGFVILQEFIPHEFEWRVVAIGNSFFAHKKLKINEKASGTSLKKYDNPPLYLFDFVKEIMDKFGFYSEAFDLFETKDGNLLINEMQCMFGQSDPYQMLVNGNPGRYKYVNNGWLFEEGDYASNNCFNLRVENILSLLSVNKGK